MRLLGDPNVKLKVCLATLLSFNLDASSEQLAHFLTAAQRFAKALLVFLVKQLLNLFLVKDNAFVLDVDLQEIQVVDGPKFCVNFDYSFLFRAT